MSFSRTTLKQQREKELKALRIFLIYSFTASLAFHIIVIIFGITNLLTKVPEIEDEPIEITLIDTLPEEEKLNEVHEVKSEQKVKPIPKPKKVESLQEPLQQKPELKPEPKPEPKPELKPEPKLTVPDISQISPNLNSADRKSKVSGGKKAKYILSEPNPTPKSRVNSQTPPTIEKQLIKKEAPLFKPFKKIEPFSQMPSAPPVAVRKKPAIQPKNNPITPPLILKKEPVIQPKKARIIPTLTQKKEPVIQPKKATVTPPLALGKKPVIQPDKSQPIANNSVSPKPAKKPDSTTKRELFGNTNPAIQPPQPTSKANEDLSRLLAQQRDSQKTPKEFSPNTTNTTNTTSSIQPPPLNQQDSGKLRDTFPGVKKPRKNHNIGSSNRTSSPSSTSNSDTSSQKEGAFGDSNTEVATAPTTPNPGNSNGLNNGTGNSIGDVNGRAACRRCRTSYPNWARQRGVEGTVVVAVNTDPQGNVTSVELLNSSGNKKLDREHLKLARKWKLKPSTNGRQGVRIVTKYKLK